jgi:hypothetical protein
MHWAINSIIAFFLTAFTEVLWVLWMRRTAAGKAMSSAIFGSALWLCGAGVILSYVENRWMLIPAVFGSFISGYITVKIDSRKSRR